MTSPVLLLNLCEQILPSEKKVKSYINPLVQWMTDEWKAIKVRLADYMIAIANGENPKSLLEAKGDIWFPQGKQNQIQQQIDDLFKTYKGEIVDRAKDIERQAKIDAYPPGLLDWSDNTPIQIKLSKEGIEELIKELTWQKDFVDNFKLDTKDRVRSLLKSRYGSVGEFRNNANRTFRIDRDKVISNFKVDVQDFADRVIDGRMSADDFVANMRSAIEEHYKTAYKLGKGITSIDEMEEELIIRQAQGQMQYLNRFNDVIKTKQLLGKELTAEIRWRAGLYAERGKAIFEVGNVMTMPMDALITWHINPAEHCLVCPQIASNSPYTKASLPCYPGDGSTPCKVNCECNLEISDLYVTQKDLGI